VETEGGTAALEEAASETADLNPAYFVDDKLFTGSILDISPEDIVTMNIVKNDPAYPQGKIMIYTKQGGKAPEKAVAAAEKIAEYKGGMQALLKFMNDNIKYPKDVQLEKTERVIVQFEICPDGSVRNARIMKGSSSPECDAEALRIVNLSSGNWIPAENDGKPVASKFTIPISFKSTK
jgi:TonB family protein